MKCELCNSTAVYVDHAVTDVMNSRRGEVAYRDQYLCWLHGQYRLESNTARVEKLEHIDAESL